MYYVTSNKAKIRVAEKYLSPLGVVIQAKPLDLVEVQSDDIEEIAVVKAKQAFAAVKKPLFVNDAGWYITALKGFPGPFMKYMNQWLTSEDVLALMAKHKDREVVFREVICYIDGEQTKTFTGESVGRVLTLDTAPEEIFSHSIFSFSATRKSIAECWKLGIPSVDNYEIWEDFAGWYADMNSLAALTV